MSEQTCNAVRLRELATSLDCFTDQDFQLLAGITPNTAEAWRKRRKGPDYIRIGNQILYPRKAVAKHLDTLIRQQTSSVGASL
jgi:hypothetical protein